MIRPAWDFNKQCLSFVLGIFLNPLAATGNLGRGIHTTGIDLCVILRQNVRLHELKSQPMCTTSCKFYNVYT